MPLEPGQRFDRYVVESLLGQGGWGQVYRAIDARLQRRVALKVLREDRASDAPRFLREARAAAALSHPNVVAVYDLGEAEGRTFIAMELVEGKLLSAFVGNPDVALGRKLAWLLDVARGLGAAHKAGLIHRDVKPQNVMVSSDGVVKILDFGLAKRTAPAPLAVPGERSSALSMHTAVGRVVGTPRYMAPEQLAGRPLDARVDQYGWGLLAYELFASHNPQDHGLAPPLLLSELVPGFPFELAVAIARTLALDPADRYATMDDLVKAVEAAPRPTETERRASTPDATAPTARAPMRVGSSPELAPTKPQPPMDVEEEVAPAADVAAAPPADETTKPPPQRALAQTQRSPSVSPQAHKATAVSPRWDGPAPAPERGEIVTDAPPKSPSQHPAGIDLPPTPEPPSIALSAASAPPKSATWVVAVLILSAVGLVVAVGAAIVAFMLTPSGAPPAAGASSSATPTANAIVTAAVTATSSAITAAPPATTAATAPPPAATATATATMTRSAKTGAATAPKPATTSAVPQKGPTLGF